MSRLLVGTRSADKLREIREILSRILPLTITSAAEIGISRAPEEDDLEVFDTFEENALAKARYFADRSGDWVLADDSGLCVDALRGAPGVRSKRFAADLSPNGLDGKDVDRANNALLLERLEGKPLSERSAHYYCAVAVVSPSSTERVFTGTCHGIILPEPRGEGGFGYDPLFYLPSEGATFGELPPEVKNRISHRARAISAAGEALSWLVDSGSPER